MNVSAAKTKYRLAGHAAAAFSALVWGVTFIASKHLLAIWTPAEVMCMRFVIGYAALWCLHPGRGKCSRREEWLCFLMGVSGCSLYYFFENVALTHTYAANVSILVSVAPVFTAVLAALLTRRARLTGRTWLGFALALAGVALVVFNGSFRLQLSPRGDLMSLGAALCWAIYAILQDRSMQTLNPLLAARKIAFYGLITGLPLLALPGGISGAGLAPLLDWVRIGCLLFLGILGSGLCYFTWNWAQPRLGVIATNNYVFVIPFVTLAASALVLREPITLMGVAGAVLILAGVAVAGE